VQDELRAVVELELDLLRPAARASGDRLRELLHPDFVEFGVSGRCWDRDSIIDTLTTSDGTTIAATDVDARRLAEDVVLVTYRSEAGDLKAWRSSIWRRDDGRWQMFVHQGTKI
jgi:hypothetical protein